MGVATDSLHGLYLLSRDDAVIRLVVVVVPLSRETWKEGGMVVLPIRRILAVTRSGCRGWSRAREGGADCVLIRGLQAITSRKSTEGSPLSPQAGLFILCTNRAIARGKLDQRQSRRNLAPLLHANLLLLSFWLFVCPKQHVTRAWTAQ